MNFRFRILALSLAALCMTVGAAQAATFNVNSTDDGPAGSCDVTPNGCTLREAIVAANANANPGTMDTITFDVTGEIQLTEGALRISQDLEILGPGAGVLTVRAGSPDPDDICQRAFRMDKVDVNNDPDFDLTLSGLTVTGGDVRDGCIDDRPSDDCSSTNDDDGGGGFLQTGCGASDNTIRIIGCHFLDNKADGTDKGGGGISITKGRSATIAGPDCVIRGNSADGAEGGGGIRADVCGEGLTVDDCLIEQNSADGADDGGGGIYNRCYLDLRNSTVRDNSADDIPSSGGGGGISIGDAWVVIADTEISGNHANLTDPSDSPFESGGGGIYADTGPIFLDRVAIHDNESNGTSGGGGIFVQSAGTVVLNNTTVSGNVAERAEDGGGGVFNSESEMFLNNSTISNNRTTPLFPDEPLSGTGGGLRENNSGVTTVNNSIIAGNFARGVGDGQFSDCFTEDGDFVTLGHNLFGTGTGCRKLGDSCGNDLDCDNRDDCDGEETCDGGLCVSPEENCPPCEFNSDCDDGNPGNGEEICDDDAGVCLPGVPPCAGDELYDDELESCFPVAAGDKMTDDVSTVLGPLGSNGGPTQTHPLIPGSPAIDCGDPDGCTRLAEFGDEWPLRVGVASFQGTNYSGVNEYEVEWDDDTFVYTYRISNDASSTEAITGLKIEFNPDCTIDDQDPPPSDISPGSVTWAVPIEVDRDERFEIESLCGPGDSTMSFDGGGGFEAQITVPGPQDNSEDDLYNLIDQRGEIRPFDGDDDGTATCDIGAFEFQPGEGLYFSVPLTHHAYFPAGITTMFQNLAHRIDFGPPATLTYSPPFVPWLPDLRVLDGLDMNQGNILFSIAETAVVAHTGGVIRIYESGVYEVDEAGTITEKLRFSDFGPNITGLDAFDWLGGNRYLFSVDHVQTVRVGSKLKRLYPGIIYKFKTNPVRVKNWFKPPGAPDIDAFDALGDGTVVFSTRENAFAVVNGQLFHYFDELVYRCERTNCVPEVYFDASEFHILGLDAVVVDESDP